MLAWIGFACFSTFVDGQEIPYAQDKPPGPPLTAEQAIAKMTVPEGFKVELFAAEPDVVNPVAMTFDERGRVWVTESVEYPNKAAGPGRDRIRILEDTNGDGRADKVTVFAEGLNIPSGIALGFGGAFVANAPDLLFLQDTDGDGKADKREALLTGFGRTDTHELPSCLTWGPDGWLYGLNGVFNHSTVVHQNKTHRFNCALWRYHPKTRAFELFAEGTSNPWGLEYNRDGEFFVTACVIDHLWHLKETGYYHRQSGAYPPYAWKIESIVRHKHQKAAYCGLCEYDADVYPEEYRGTLFMGNIHGSCINSDSLERKGASYFGSGRPDFLSAHDAWFMPVVQKVGPDGCLWILDWYDRYHCYQDANRDPEGIDRLRGRLYRVTYRNAPMPGRFDLKQRSDDELVDMLNHANVYYRRWARQLLIERGTSRDAMVRLALSSKTPKPQRMEAIWTLASSSPEVDWIGKLLADADPLAKTWGLRMLAAAESAAPVQASPSVKEAARHADPAVRAQALITASRKLGPSDRLEVAFAVLSATPADESGLLVRLAWKQMEPLLASSPEPLRQWLAGLQFKGRADLAELMPRIVDRLLSEPKGHDAVVAFVESLIPNPDESTAGIAADCLEQIVNAAVVGRIERGVLERLRRATAGFDEAAKDQTVDPRVPAAVALRLALADASVQPMAAALLRRGNLPLPRRATLFRALVVYSETAALEVLLDKLHPADGGDDSMPIEFLAAMGRAKDPAIATALVDCFERIRPTVRPQVLDLLSSRPAWARTLLEAISAKRIPTAVVNVNQIRKMRDMPDEVCQKKVREIWGSIREERDRARERIVDHFEEVLATGRGDPQAGGKVFARVCAQCHRYRNEGHDVGPSLNENGRSSVQQLVSNILDPNLVIGKDYQARIVSTVDGRVVTGLIQEDSAEKVVLKVAGGKLETFARSEIEQQRESKVSLMPEDIEKQVTEQEFRDLVAYLLLDEQAAGK